MLNVVIKNMLPVMLHYNFYEESKGGYYLTFQQFSGHSSPVSILQFTPFSLPVQSSTVPDDGFYFLSGAKEDRLISVW